MVENRTLNEETANTCRKEDLLRYVCCLHSCEIFNINPFSPYKCTSTKKIIIVQVNLILPRKNLTLSLTVIFSISYRFLRLSISSILHSE